MYIYVRIHKRPHTYPVKANVFTKCVTQNLNKINSTLNPPLNLVVHTKVIGEYIWLSLIAATDYPVTTYNLTD